MTEAPAGGQAITLTYVQPGRRAGVAVCVVLIALWLAEMSFVSFLPVWDVVLLGIGAVALVVSAALQWRAGIWADPAGIRGRNQYGRTRQLDWQQVHHFELRGFWRGIGVRTVDGQWIGLMQYGMYDQQAWGIEQRLEAYRWEQQRALGIA